MEKSTKDILYSSAAIAAIRYAYIQNITMEYVLRAEGNTYTDILRVLDSTSIEDIVVDDIGRRLVVSPSSRNDTALRILFAEILRVVPFDDDNVDVSATVKDMYNQYSTVLGITGMDADTYAMVFIEQMTAYQNEDVQTVFESIDNTFSILTRGYQHEWRNRLLSSNEPNPDEEADYKAKFGQPYTDELSEGVEYYNVVDRLPVASNPKYSKAIYTATAVMDDQTGLEGDVLDGYALFNMAQISEDIPLVLYVRNDNEKYYKILDGFEVTESINYMFIRPFEPASAVLQREPIVIERSGGRGRSLIREEVTSQYNDANTIQYIYRYGNNYINIILYLETRDVRINIYSGELQGVERIGDITIAGLTATNVDGKFDIYGGHMPPFVIEDVMTADIMLSRMFDILEVTNISASHITPSYVYEYPYIEDIAQLKLNIVPVSIRFHIENSYVTGPEFDSNGVQIPVGTAKTTVHFNPIESTADLDRFMVFMRLFAAYIFNVQYELFDLYYSVTGVSYPNYTRVSTLETRSILKSRRPDIFIDGYSTICQSDRQPQIISQDEYDKLNRGERSRALLFPRAPVGDVDDQIILYCPDRDAPYPTLKRNTLINREQFPVLPCCQANDTQTRRNIIEYYNVTGQYSRNTRTIGDDLVILRTLQILQPGAASQVLRTNIPALYNALGFSGGTAIKVGVVQDNNSFISACAYLLGDPELTRDAVLADEWNSALVAQECYDDPSPRQTLENPDTVFDDRYYRIIEAMYNVTIYVMHHNNNNIEFKLPRHIPPYVRNYRNNPCIIVLETIDQGRPNYEPILYRTITTDDETGQELITDSTILSPQSNRIIFNEYYMRTVGTFNGDSTYIPLNLPTDGAIGQLIDRDGKMRGLSYSTHSIIVEPGQPLDLPSITIDQMTAANSLQHIRSMFPDVELDFTSRYSGIGLNGVWYTVENIQCFSLVTDEVKELTNIPISTRSVPYIDVSTDYDWYDFVYSYETQRATLNVILDFIYHVYYYNGRSNQLFYIDDSPDSLDDYTIDRIPHDLNVELTLEQAAALSNIVRLIDGQYRIYLYSRQFADGVLYHVNRLLTTNVVPVTTLATPPLNYSTDYNIYKGDEQYTLWLDLTNFEVRQYTYVPIVYDSIYPYIYTKNSTYFIIQPVSPKNGQGEARATYVASMWRKTRINYGFNPSIDDIGEIEIGAPTEVVNGQIVNVYSDFFYSDNRIYAILPFEDLDETVILENRRAEEYRVWQGQGTVESTTRVISKRGGTRGGRSGRGRTTDTSTGPRGGSIIRGRRGRGRPRGQRGRRTTTVTTD